MKAMKSLLNPSELVSWAKSLQYKKDTTGVLMAYGQGQGLPSPCTAINEIKALTNAKALHLMVNIIPPGVVVKPHIDYIPGKRTVPRWHLPIQTKPGAWYWDKETGKVFMAPGYWWGIVPYWGLHSVGNESSVERIHIIVDLDVNIEGNYA